ncbi:endonuclease/exonuclease/phosphatase family protein [Deinococcus budaensis]|uniref:Vancomycin resistance protein VanJ n=1 Tax=Deinococcus budaensis TaxID=1665626 RepID=A0A7W8GGY0_9DEIO|nr:endonuclease/exonuclease/phosphatase family protein [Deinococcus budaensis]MBB5235451.1 vancomycin resistance protein VanJ [Deinococcus budaensis]
MRRLPALSLLFAALALAGGLLARAHSETCWWVAVLDLVPPQALLPVPLLLAWRASGRRRWGWAAFNVAVALAFTVGQVGAVLPDRLAGAAQRGAPLRVLTLNANFAGADPTRLAALVRQERVDVLTLQETLDRGRDAGYGARVQAALPGWSLARHDELVTLARWPLRESRAVTFPSSPHAVLVTSLEVAGRDVTVVNTHLPTLALLPSPSDTRLRRTLPQRVARRLTVRREFVGVVAGLLRGAPGPLILAGDLNAPPRGELHARLHALGLTDAFQAGGTGLGFTHHARFGHSRIDYVWARGVQAERALALPDVLSDHRAVLAELRLAP